MIVRSVQDTMDGRGIPAPSIRRDLEFGRVPWNETDLIAQAITITAQITQIG